jgi:hypothetical protein
MTQPTSNILPFPITRPLPTMKVLSLQERALQFAVAASTEEHNALSDDHAVHVAAVVRASIRFGRRKGARLDSLPPLLRTWLLELCHQGDPTCRMIRDWLTGNHRFRAPLSRENA